jgi:hypothetical protein
MNRAGHRPLAYDAIGLSPPRMSASRIWMYLKAFRNVYRAGGISMESEMFDATIDLD